MVLLVEYAKNNFYVLRCANKRNKTKVTAKNIQLINDPKNQGEVLSISSNIKDILIFKT